MGIFSQLSIARVKSKIRKTILVDEQAIHDIEQLKIRLNNLILQKDDESIFLAGLHDAKRDDLEILHLLRISDDENYARLKTVLSKIQELSKQSTHEALYSVDKYCQDILDATLLSEELHKQEAYDTLREFQDLVCAQSITEEQIDSFIDEHSAFFKTKTNKKLRKSIEKLLKERLVDIEKNVKGPIITDHEISLARTALHQYFDSPHFLKFMSQFRTGKMRIRVVLCGSLVTGFSSTYSAHRGLPSDYGRVSDVDIGIVIDNAVMSNITLGGRLLFKQGTYYGPFFVERAEKLGPFQKIFDFLKENFEKVLFVES